MSTPAFWARVTESKREGLVTFAPRASISSPAATDGSFTSVAALDYCTDPSAHFAKYQTFSTCEKSSSTPVARPKMVTDTRTLDLS